MRYSSSLEHLSFSGQNPNNKLEVLPYAELVDRTYKHGIAGVGLDSCYIRIRESTGRKSLEDDSERTMVDSSL